MRATKKKKAQVRVREESNLASLHPTRVRTAAVEVIETILAHGGTLLPSTTLHSVETTLLSILQVDRSGKTLTTTTTLLEREGGEGERGATARFRHSLYKAIMSRLIAGGGCSSFPSALVALREGQSEPHFLVASYCTQSLAVPELAIHPRMPPYLVPPAPLPVLPLRESVPSAAASSDPVYTERFLSSMFSDASSSPSPSSAPKRKWGEANNHSNYNTTEATATTTTTPTPMYSTTTSTVNFAAIAQQHLATKSTQQVPPQPASPTFTFNLDADEGENIPIKDADTEMMDTTSYREKERKQEKGKGDKKEEREEEEDSEVVEIQQPHQHNRDKGKDKVKEKEREKEKESEKEKEAEEFRDFISLGDDTGEHEGEDDGLADIVDADPDSSDMDD